jgi:hypothetical protein
LTGGNSGDDVPIDVTKKELVDSDENPYYREWLEFSVYNFFTGIFIFVLSEALK